MIDEVYYFKKYPKPSYFLKDSFKIPKRDGDYFEKLKADTNFKEEQLSLQLIIFS